MGYFEHLKQLLQSLRLYDLNVGAGRAELNALGKEMDRHQAALDKLEREAIASTADDYGLGMYEAIMPFVPAYQLAEERRRAISALMRIDDMSFTLAALNDTVAGCGIEAELREGEESGTVVVSIINSRGVPEDFSHIQRRIEQILPCHLEPVYKFIYTTWSELMSCIKSWNEISSAGLNWREMEIYTEA